MQTGTIVKSKLNGSSGIVLALTKDGKRAKVHSYYHDADVWCAVESLIVDVCGKESCHKCSGSGNYYHGGAVVNGVYTGQILDCNACRGKGWQDNADRIRNHWYWRKYARIAIA